jgi:hypothetical protein
MTVNTPTTETIVQPAIAESKTAQPWTAKPAPAKPATAKPGTAKRGTAQPTAQPNVRLLDPRGVRFGAGLSVVVLAFAFIVNAPILVAAIWLGLGASAVLGTRYWPLARPWPYVRAALRLPPPAELEAEYPPRFAQALGSAVLTPAVILFALGATPWAWLPVAAVGGLQALLAVTGYCLGCRLYFLRWWVPSLFDRLTRRVAAAG